MRRGLAGSTGKCSPSPHVASEDERRDSGDRPEVTARSDRREVTARSDSEKMTGARLLLQALLVLLLVKVNNGESTGSGCPPGMQWSNDLGKCKDCKICDSSSKDDFCQKCEDSDKSGDFPWLIVISVTAVSVFCVTLVLGLAIYLVRCRPKKKFTTPIEETGASSAEELLIH